MAIRERYGRWQVDVKVGGKRVRKQAGSYAEAERIEELLRAAAPSAPGTRRRGRSKPAEVSRDASLHGVLQLYLEDLRDRDSRPGSVSAASVHTGVLTRVLGVKTPVETLTPKTLSSFAATRRQEGVTASTINGSLRVLRAALRFAKGEGVIPTAPPVKMLKETKKLPTILTVEEVDKIANLAPPAARMAIFLAAYTGLRHQEILHLRWSDIRPGQVQVTAKGTLWTPKSHCERVVPVAPSGRLEGEIEAWRALSPDPTPHMWVFLNAERERMNTLVPQVRAAFQEAKLYIQEDRPGLHMLRRTWASRLLAAGADIETVRQLGGWASIDIVQRYLNSTDGLKRQAIEALG